MELQRRLADLKSAGFGVAAISYDRPEILAAFSRQHGITFPLLSDTASATIRAYGILNTVASDAIAAGDAAGPSLDEDIKKFVAVNGSRKVAALAAGTPFPGTFTIDREGRVTSRHFEEFYRERTTIASILVRLGGQVGTVAAKQITTDHLAITAYAADATVAAGQRTALVLRVTPRPGMHVYAPGATGYRSIALTITAPPLVRVGPMQFPASEIYFFEPLNERVPVYQKPFELVQDLVIDATPQAEAALRDIKTLKLEGSLEYQACDDRICFNPVAVPLTWTLNVTSH